MVTSIVYHPSDKTYAIRISGAEEKAVREQQKRAAGLIQWTFNMMAEEPEKWWNEVTMGGEKPFYKKFVSYVLFPKDPEDSSSAHMMSVLRQLSVG